MSGPGMESNEAKMDSLIKRIRINPYEFVLKAISNEACATAMSTTRGQADEFIDLSRVAFHNTRLEE